MGKKFKLLPLCLGALVMLGGCTACAANPNDVKGIIENEKEVHDIVVVGAGISGLTCGYFLKDEDVLILEKKANVGGRTISSLHNSFSYAKGTEYIGSSEESLKKMIDELKLEPKEIPSPMDGYFDGESFYYGAKGIERYLVSNSDIEEYGEFSSLISEEYEKYEEIPYIEYNDHVKELDHITASDWLQDNDISDVYIKKYNVTSKGLFGATMDEISALSFIPEAAFDYEGNSEDEYLDYDFEDSIQEYEDALKENSGSYSFETGLTELTNKLYDVLKEKIYLNSTVISVKKDGDLYEITYVDELKNSYKVYANKVVMAVPSPEVLNVASSVLTEDKEELMKSIRFSSYVTVALFSDEPIFDKAFDLAVPDDYFFTDVYDATWIERYYNEDKKDIEEYIATVYVAPKISSDHSIDFMTDEEILENVYKDLDKIFPEASDKVTGYDIEHFPFAYPIMDTGAYERLIELNNLNHGSFILAGDYMMYPTFEAAVESGYLASERIKEYSDN